MPSESDTALSSESRKSSFTILSSFASALHVREAKLHSPPYRASGNRPTVSGTMQLPSQILFQRLSNRVKLAPMTREEVTSAIRAAKAARKLTWQEIAQEVGKIAGLEHLRVSWSKQHVRRTSGQTGFVSRVVNVGFGPPPAMPN